MNINEFLIKRYRFSTDESVTFLKEQNVLINNQPAIQRQSIGRHDGITINGVLVRAQEVFVYYAFYKPRGIECTLNAAIPDNLLSVISFQEDVYPIGRLDKDSEGLLILTNDGSLYKEVALAERWKEKEYIVEVDQALLLNDIRSLSEGVFIKGQMTRPAQVELLNSHSFRIVLTQGINRQIRRMCYKLGYQVTRLKRIRITNVRLGELKPGEYVELNKEDIL